MSEGYRAALAMLIDIFRHMVAAYGVTGLVESVEGQLRISKPAVVLIDEVDAHLHPEWQRKIGFWLKDHFPAVQFIVTTHSPIVCQAADHGLIFHIPPPGKGAAFKLGEADANTIMAGRPDQILLTPAFGLEHTRSARAVTKRRRFGELKAKQLQFGELDEDELQEFRQLSLFVPEERAVI